MMIAFLSVIQTPQAMGMPTKHQKASALLLSPETKGKVFVSDLMKY